MYLQNNQLEINKSAWIKHTHGAQYTAHMQVRSFLLEKNNGNIS